MTSIFQEFNMTFKPTPEQEAIVLAAKKTTDNLIVQALAGAAKTSTLVLLADALNTTSILCLAFNKRIAVEMTERLPPNCVAKTLNGLGHQVWGQFLGKRLTLEKSKVYELVKEEAEKLSGRDKEDFQEIFQETMQAVSAGKTCGYIPTGKFPFAKGLMDDDDFLEWSEERYTDLQWDIIRRVTEKSIQQGLTGLIDFDDQILLPTVFPCSFLQYPVVMIDEAQDLSALNHATLRKIAKKRLIAVGDPCQAIYGFRGAHENSMELLQETFNMKTLILSVSFRCPITVVEEARWRAPHMQYPEWAKPGQVRRITEWDKTLVEDGAAIICRNNAPLFSMAIKLLRHGRYPHIVGNDIGLYLIKQMKKLGKLSATIPQAKQALADWQDAKLKKVKNASKVHDQVACIKVFLDNADTLGGAITYAEHIFNSQGPVLLMTGHKSKGLEFDHVYLLDEHLIKHEDGGQEANLRYVIQTRAKQTLTYLDSDGFHDEFAE
jgi:DNA helicase II / ATP-dependent DNA helicase PcrA